MGLNVYLPSQTKYVTLPSFLYHLHEVMKHIEQIQSPLRKRGSLASSRTWTAPVFLTAFLLCVTSAFCQERKPITPEKAMTMGYVEDFFNNNFRDITSRKTVTWGELEKHDNGSVSIVYRHEATIWGRDVILDERRFTFDKEWNVKSWDRTEGFPKPVGNESRERNAVERGVAIEALTQYPVNKKVFEFKDDDISTPEAFYAAFNKVSASKDRNLIAAKLTEYSADKTNRYSPDDMDFYVNMRDDFVEALRTANILKVCVYDQQAIVIAHLPGESIRSPYDVRWLKNIGGQWLNAGNDRVNSEEEAIAKFARNVEKAKDVQAANVVPPADGGFVSPNGNLTHLVVCGPAGDFEPRTYQDYHNLCDEPIRATGANKMYSKMQTVDGKNLMLTLTDDPEKLRKAIETLPQIEYLRTERLSKETFEEHIKPWVGRSVTAEGMPISRGQ